MALRLRTVISSLCVLSLFTVGNAALAQGKTESSVGTEITVYNQNFGLVKDQRILDLKNGVNTIRFTDVAQQIDPTSVHFKSITDPGSIEILEQNYQYDLISPDKLLEKYIGKEITVRTQVDKIEKTLHGTLLSSQDGLVLQTADGLVLKPTGTIELPSLPEGLISKPTLVWTLDAQKPGTHRTEISYITNGLTWKADYVVVVGKNDNLVDLTGWVTLDNQSGASYKDARLKLVAGDVHRVTPTVKYDTYSRNLIMAKAASSFVEKPFFEYHLYTLNRKTTLNNRETKQVSLLSANSIPVQRKYIFESTHGYYLENNTQKVQVFLDLMNSQANHLGMPLPKGKIRVYKSDEDGLLQFVGEDQIDHTPKDEKIHLNLGNAFDLTGERKRIDYKKISDRVREETFEISLRNHKNVPVVINVVEHPAGDWQILQTNFKYTKKDSSTVEFPIQVMPNQSQKLVYRIRTQ